MLGFRLPFARRKGYGMGAAGGGNEGVAGDPAFVFDQFTDANGTALASHAIAPTNTPATSWTAFSSTGTSTIQIQSNAALSISTVGGQPRYGGTVSAGVSDCTVSSVFQITTNGGGTLGIGGIAVRFTDANNFWLIQIDKNSNTFRIFERNAGVETQRASIAFTPSLSTNYTIQAVLSGNTITATVDGSNQISYASATFQNTATRHGIFQYQQNGFLNHCQWDDFKVIA